MDDRRVKLFIDEINLMIDYCFYSFNQMNKVLISIDRGEKFDRDYFWYYSQTFITYAANISKLLWPTKNRNETSKEFSLRKEFRNELRDLLGVERNILLNDKKLRNRFEHLDENLDNFKENVIFSKNFGPVTGLIQMDGKDYNLSKQKQLRHYDPYSKTLYLYGEKMNIQDLYNEIKSLSEKVAEFEKRGNEIFHSNSQQSRLRSVVPIDNQSAEQDDG